MKKVTTPAIFVACIIGLILISNRAYSQGNSGGNANNNNNANGNALKWETQGNNADTDDFIGTTNSTALKIRTNNEERLRITPDGRIGAGILNPLERFELQGNLKLTGDIIFSDYADANDTTGRLLFVDKDGRTTHKTLKSLKDELYKPIPIGDCDIDGSGNIIEPVWSNGLNKIYNECPINLGVRTNNPKYTIDARGHIRGTRSLFLGIPVATQGEQFNDLARIHVINANNLAPDNKGDFIRFDEFESGSLKTVYKVDQKGFVTARDVKVTLTSIPDFVFKQDYALPTIEEQASFINTNGHLLRMPSEKQIIEENIGLGEITMANLQISEEQMLYLIQVNKEVKELEKENDDLKERVEQLEGLVKQLLEK